MCDVCEEVKLLNKENRLYEERKNVYHCIRRSFEQKKAMREERKRDREGKIPLLCFDLKNLLSFSKTEISFFFNKSKFLIYNMTAHV